MNRNHVESASDDALLQRAKLGTEGSDEAFAELWRRHSPAVIAATRAFTGFDPDDIAQEAFERVLVQIRAGGGPDIAFRAYVLTTARNVAINKSKRKSSDEVTGVDDEIFEARGFAQPDTAAQVLGDGFTLQVFQSLPVRWQEVLWYRDVEDLPIHQICTYLDMTENATSALLKRAREGFKQSWIAANVAPELELPADCAWATERMAQFTRKRTNSQVTARIAAHLETCAHCQAVARESQQINSNLALSLLPAMLGGAGAAGYLTWLQTPTSANAATDQPPRLRKLLVVLSALCLVAVIAVAAVVHFTHTKPAPLGVASSPSTPDAPREDVDGKSPTSSIDPKEPEPEATAAATASDDQSSSADADGGATPSDEKAPIAPDAATESSPAEVPSVTTTATLTAGPVDGQESGVLPRLAGTAVPGARVVVTVVNEQSRKLAVATTASSSGAWSFTPRGIRGTLSITASQTYTSGGIQYVEDPIEVGTFAAGEGLRISVTEAGAASSTLRISRLGEASKNEVANVRSSEHGLIVDKHATTEPGAVVVTVPYARSDLGTLTFWQGDTSVGPPRDWVLQR